MKFLFLKMYAIAFAVFLALDMVWLGLIARSFYAKQIGGLLKPEVNWWAAILFYLLFVVGLLVFVIYPALEQGSWQHALIYGALFGLVCYATYDLTNLAVAKEWTLFITIVDLLWGTFLAASVSIITYYIVRILG